MSIKTLVPAVKKKIKLQVKNLETALNSSKIDKINKKIYIETIDVLNEAHAAFEEVQKTRPGRKTKVDYEKIRQLRENGETLESIARTLNISLSSVCREIKLFKQETPAEK